MAQLLSFVGRVGHGFIVTEDGVKATDRRSRERRGHENSRKPTVSGCQAVEKTCHSEPVTDVTGVGIRNLLTTDLHENA